MIRPIAWRAMGDVRTMHLTSPTIDHIYGRDVAPAERDE
jgi:hypothetical protein